MTSFICLIFFTVTFPLSIGFSYLIWWFLFFRTTIVNERISSERKKGILYILLYFLDFFTFSHTIDTMAKLSAVITAAINKLIEKEINEFTIFSI